MSTLRWLYGFGLTLIAFAIPGASQAQTPKTVSSDRESIIFPAGCGVCTPTCEAPCTVSGIKACFDLDAEACPDGTQPEHCMPAGGCDNDPTTYVCCKP